MTSSEFLAIFKKHLRVAEPQRASLIAEMQAHLDELESEQDPITALGYPMDLARKYNRTHIGPLGSTFLLFSLPAIFTLLVWVSFGSHGYYFGLPTWAIFFTGYIPALTFLGFCALVGVALQRTHHPAFALLGLIVSSLISPTVVLVIIEYFSWLQDPGLGYLGAIFGQGHGDPPAGYPFQWAYNIQAAFGVAFMGTVAATTFTLLSFAIFASIQKFAGRLFKVKH